MRQDSETLARSRGLHSSAQLLEELNTTSTCVALKAAAEGLNLSPTKSGM